MILPNLYWIKKAKELAEGNALGIKKQKIMTDKEKIEESNKVIQKRYEVIEDLFTVGKKISYYQESIGKTPCIISEVYINAKTLKGTIELTPTISTGDKITIVL